MVAELEILLGLQGLATVTAGLNETRAGLEGVAAGGGAFNKAAAAFALEQTGHALTGIAEGVGKVAEEGISFQSLLQMIQNNTTMTTADVAMLHDGVLALSRDSGAGLDVLATGFMKAMNIAGNTTAAMAELRVATESAVSTGGDPAATTNVLANAMHEYGLDVSHAATEQGRFLEILANSNRVMGVMHLAAAEGNMTLEQFSEHSGRAIGIAANLGVGLEDVSAAFAALTKHGFDPAGAQVQVVDMLTHMINPTKAMLKEIDDLKAKTGIDLHFDFSAEGLHAKGLNGVLADIRRAFQAAGFSEDEATQHAMRLINAQRGGLGVAALIGTGWADYNSILKDLDDTQKVNTVTAEAFARTQATVAFQLNRLRAVGQAALVVLGEAMLPSIGRLLGVVTPLVERVAKWAEAHAKLLGPILATVAAVAGLLGVLMTAGGTLLFAQLAFGALTGAVVALGVAMGVVEAGAGVGMFAALAAIGPEVLPVVLGVAAALGLLGLAWHTNAGNIRGVTDVLASVPRYFYEVIRGGDALNDWLTHLPARWRAAFRGAGEDVAGLRALVLALPAVFGALKFGLQTGDFLPAISAALSAALSGFGIAGAARLARPIEAAVRTVQLLRDTVITARQAFAGDWLGGQDTRIPLAIRAIGRGIQLARDAIITVQQALRGEWWGGQDERVLAPIRLLGRGVQLARDAVLTVKQALAGQWVPDGSIQPVVRWLGEAVLAGRRLVDWARTALPAGRDFVVGAFHAIHDAITGRLLPALGQARDYFTGTILPAIERVAGVIRSTLGPVLAWLAEHWRLVSVVGTVVVGFLAGLPGWLVLGAAAIKLLVYGWQIGWETIKANALAFITQTLPGWLAALGGWLTGTALPWIGARLREMGLRFGTWVLDGIQALQTNLPLWLGALRVWLEGTALPWVRQSFVDFAHEFGYWIGNTAIPFLLVQLPLWLEALRVWLEGTAIPNVKEWVGRLAVAFGEWIGRDAIPFLLLQLPLWLAAFNQWLLTTAIPAVATFLGPLAKKFGEWVVTDAIPFLLVQLPLWLAAFNQWTISTLIPAVAKFGLDVGTAFVEGIIEGLAKRFPALIGILEKLGIITTGPTTSTGGTVTPGGGGGGSLNPGTGGGGGGGGFGGGGGGGLFTPQSFTPGGTRGDLALAGGGNTFVFQVQIDGTGIGAEEAGAQIAKNFYATFRGLIEGGGGGGQPAPAGTVL